MDETSAKYKDINHQLILACKKGDYDAKMQIYTQFSKKIFNSCLRILKNRFDAEDIMHDAFIEAFRKISSYKESGSFEAWIRRIAVNKSIDHIKGRKMMIELEDIPDNVINEEEAELPVNTTNIKQAMNSLSDDYRIIISLYLFEGYDHHEISEILGISYNLSRTRFSRARQSLVVKLAKIQSRKEEKWA